MSFHTTSANKKERVNIKKSDLTSEELTEHMRKQREKHNKTRYGKVADKQSNKFIYDGLIKKYGADFVEEVLNHCEGNIKLASLKLKRGFVSGEFGVKLVIKEHSISV